MILIIGGYASGKHDYAHQQLKCIPQHIFTVTGAIVADYGRNPEGIYRVITSHPVVITTETGCGLIPADQTDMRLRELSGQLNCRLAADAACVIRMVCGIPQIIRGTLPDSKENVC